MKTHDFAKFMSQLSRILRSMPNVELDDLRYMANRSSERIAPQNELGFDNIPAALDMLLALGDVPKAQWFALINEFGFPIEVRSKDSSRDIMDRIFRYLQSNPEGRNKLSHAPSSGRSTTSPELTKALQILLRA